MPHPTSSKKYALVCAYFGETPIWMPFFLKTAAANPQADFILFTDYIKVDLETYTNIVIYQTTLESTFDRVRVLLNQELPNLKKTRQLCNLKPIYGILYEKELSGYPFWGFIDIDVFYGNLNNFITDTILDDNDIISTSRQVTCGHFCLFRNNHATSKIILDVPFLIDYIDSGIGVAENTFGAHIIYHKNLKKYKYLFKEMVYDDNLYNHRGRTTMDALVNLETNTVTSPLMMNSFAYVHFQDNKKDPNYFSLLSNKNKTKYLLLTKSKCIELSTLWNSAYIYNLAECLTLDFTWFLKFYVKKLLGKTPYPIE